MTWKTINRRIAVEKRCSDCALSKLVKEVKGPYGLVYYDYKCYYSSDRGRKVEGELMYSCPMGKELDL